MEPTQITYFLDHLIRLEIHVGVLYRKFAERFVEDRAFWMQLSEEEFKHADLLTQIASNYPVEDRVETCNESTQMPLDTEIAEMMIQRVASLIHEIDSFGISRKEAVWSALQLERSAGEFHMNSMIHSYMELDSIKLWECDFEHATRIESYLRSAA